MRLGRWNDNSSVYCVNGICSDPSIDVPIENTWQSYRISENALGRIGVIKLAKDVQYTSNTKKLI